ncbi:hypothetical protein DPMN_175661 [Dreissena polymorpha]|uniref:Uncharacterized protein n=1 Tax=Dreissena polymorpha TaxID=45954 RepID=A0A9D4E7Q2_DREPO|nr:hypothetical protein DPMN_175661 [Dreissena polymorpha]
MLRIILIRIRRKAEEQLSEEQSGLRAGWSIVGKIFSCKMRICNTNVSSSTT